MQTPEEVQVMFKLASLGWVAKRISRKQLWATTKRLRIGSDMSEPSVADVT